MSTLPDFRANDEPTLGIELELMLVDPQSFDLTPSAVAIERRARELGAGAAVKLEITQSMIEVNSGVHLQHAGLWDELRGICSVLSAAARQRGARVCGGGTHPFHRWQARRISPTRRFRQLSEQYGYLAKQFTVFGQHIHVGCRDGDDAVRAVHRLSLFVPHFIALAAASPFHRGADTQFDSCRLNMIAAFPLSGRMPAVYCWADFAKFYERLASLGVVSTIKDFYWDIRPKPEFGTVELRIPDTPLDALTAADLGAYAQALVDWTRSSEMPTWLDDHVYRFNRFQAARFGFAGRVIVDASGKRVSIRDHLRHTLGLLAQRADALGSTSAIVRLANRVATAANDATWLRGQYGSTQSFADVVRLSCDRWQESIG